MYLNLKKKSIKTFLLTLISVIFFFTLFLSYQLKNFVLFALLFQYFSLIILIGFFIKVENKKNAKFTLKCFKKSK